MFFPSPALSNPNFSEAGVFCGSKKEPTASNFSPNLIDLMDKVTESVNKNRWGAYGVESPRLTSSPLESASAISRRQIAPIVFRKQGLGFLGVFPPIQVEFISMVRYDNYDFFQESLNSEHDVIEIGKSFVYRLPLKRYSTERFYSLTYEEEADHVDNNNNLGRSTNSKLNFRYEMLEEATDHFNLSRKLGEGGAGSLFKGILPDGRIVAVKRLFFNNRHWVDEFFNEVNLIGGIKHKNLVRLLGCTLKGPESLLVYEYVPNRSLDRILFVKDENNILSWKQRFDIICGIAEGLAYLHVGSGVNIIHRDIKASNILLDGQLIPKIADFGLVRCLSPDNSHTNTGIAGTLGYMTPEYLVQRQLSEKADVYAFGVLVLGIGCGRKNSVFTQGSSSVLHSVWKHYKANR